MTRSSSFPCGRTSLSLLSLFMVSTHVLFLRNLPVFHAVPLPWSHLKVLTFALHTCAFHVSVIARCARSEAHDVRQGSSELSACKGTRRAWLPPCLPTFAASLLVFVLLTCAHVFPWSLFCPEFKVSSHNTTPASEFGCVLGVLGPPFPARPLACAYPSEPHSQMARLPCAPLVFTVCRLCGGSCTESGDQFARMDVFMKPSLHCHEHADSLCSRPCQCSFGMCSMKGLVCVLLDSFLSYFLLLL